MTTSISIHPQTSLGGLQFLTQRQFRANNANSIELIFRSNEYYDRNKDGIFYDTTAITAFDLPATDAEILASVGLLDAARREALIPVLRHMLEEMNAEKEVEADG